MKRFLIASLLLMIPFVGARADEDDGLPTLMEVLVHNVFVPVGFDDNDEVTVVLDGYLPNTCYKLSHHEVAFDEATKVFTIRQFARRFWKQCRDVRTPFTSEIQIGLVPFGDFKVRVLGSVAKPLAVAEATNAGPDDHLYAPIDAARVETDPETGRQWALVTGRMPSSCMTLDELRLIDSGATLQLLPLASLRDGDDCTQTEAPFERAVDLPTGMSLGRHLLHVRSLNGKAVNVAFTVAAPEPDDAR